MKVGVVGFGYVGVGLVRASVLADKGNYIVGIDRETEKVFKLIRGVLPIHEPGLPELIQRNKSKMTFSSSYSDITGCEVIYITIPTPTINGRIDISIVEEAVTRSVRLSSESVIAIKSTVLPGTASTLSMKLGKSIVSNPEFTREGNAIEDTINLDRIVIGGTDAYEMEKIVSLWKFTNSPFLLTSNENAEMIKCDINSFLAVKILFINELANLCERIENCDIEVIANGMGYDKRISPFFLKAGIGYGGSCFPKDTEALIAYAKDMGAPLSLITKASTINLQRINHVMKIIKEALGDDLSGKHIAVLGLSSKDNTGDVRESPALKLINRLTSSGALIEAYNPIPVKTPEGLTVKSDISSISDDIDLIVIASECPHFKSLEKLKPKIPVVDAKRLLVPEAIPIYFGVGKHNAKT